MVYFPLLHPSRPPNPSQPLLLPTPGHLRPSFRTHYPRKPCSFRRSRTALGRWNAPQAESVPESSWRKMLLEASVSILLLYWEILFLLLKKRKGCSSPFTHKWLSQMQAGDRKPMRPSHCRLSHFCVITWKVWPGFSKDRLLQMEISIITCSIWRR